MGDKGGKLRTKIDGIAGKWTGLSALLAGNFRPVSASDVTAVDSHV